MDNTPKTPIQITQELLAIVSAKLEKTGQKQSSDKILKALQDEISLYGDDIASTVDRSDPYFEKNEHDEKSFREALGRLRNVAGEIPETLNRIFAQLLGDSN